MIDSHPLNFGAMLGTFHVEKRSPQQDNGYDCGAMTCLMCELVAVAYVNHNVSVSSQADTSALVSSSFGVPDVWIGDDDSW